MQCEPGSLVKIDHMIFYSKEKVIKPCNAACPKTRSVVSRAFRSDTNHSAGEFAKIAKELGLTNHRCVASVEAAAEWEWSA